MTNRLLFLCLALFLAGCATVAGKKPPPPCGDPVCSVKVTVAGSCAVSLDRDPIVIAAANRDMQIQWDIAGAQFAPQDGIFFKTPTGAEISAPQAVNAQRFAAKNRHSKPGRYEYGVRVIQDGKRCPDYDPWVVNG